MKPLKIYTYSTILDPSNFDTNNILTNQSILALLQKVASMHSLYFDYDKISTPKSDLNWIILNWKLKMFSRPNCNDEIVINTWCHPLKKFYFYRDFEIKDKSDNLVAIATSKWILLNNKTNTIYRNLDELNKFHPFLEKDIFENEPFNEKLKEPTTILNTIKIPVQRRDIDKNKHVNNIHYLDYAYEVLPESIYNNCVFNNIEIMYKHEAKYGDFLNISYSNIDNEHIVSITNSTSNILHAIIKLY